MKEVKIVSFDLVELGTQSGQITDTIQRCVNEGWEVEIMEVSNTLVVFYLERDRAN